MNDNANALSDDPRDVNGHINTFKAIAKANSFNNEYGLLAIELMETLAARVAVLEVERDEACRIRDEAMRRHKMAADSMVHAYVQLRKADEEIASLKAQHETFKAQVRQLNSFLNGDAKIMHLLQRHFDETEAVVFLDADFLDAKLEGER